MAGFMRPVYIVDYPNGTRALFGPMSGWDLLHPEESKSDAENKAEAIASAIECGAEHVVESAQGQPDRVVWT